MSETESPKPVDAGGEGGGSRLSTIIEALDSGRKRATLGMIDRGIREGWMSPWLFPDGLDQRLPARLAVIAETAEDTRSAVAAAKVLQSMKRDNIAVAEAADKAQRLDSGKPTERRAVAREWTIEIEQPPKPPPRKIVATVTPVEKSNGNGNGNGTSH